MFRYLSIISLIGLLFTACGQKQTLPDEQPEDSTNRSQVESGRSNDVQTLEVSFAAAGMTLHGEVTRPIGDSPFPAIAIAAGSGPTDRNWENPMLPGTNGSARLLASELAQNGVVVLRYDKRGTGKTGMPAAPVTWNDYVSEIGEATKLLKSLTYVDPTKIYVAGHSEGGAHVLRLAQSPPVRLAGLVLLSTPSRSMRELVIWQISAQLTGAGLNPVARKAEIDALTAALDKIAAGETVDPSRVGQLPGIQQFIAVLQNPSSVEFARELLTFEPTSAFAAIDVPVLIISGERDIQVDPELDAKPLAAAATAAGLETTLLLLPEGDHVLKLETTPRDRLDASAGLRYNAADRELAPALVETMADWMKR